jgi:hypothetical protein
VYPHTIIGYMEMFYELQTLKKGYQIQMNTHNQSLNEIFLWIVGFWFLGFKLNECPYTQR